MCAVCIFIIIVEKFFFLSRNNYSASFVVTKKKPCHEMFSSYAFFSFLYLVCSFSHEHHRDIKSHTTIITVMWKGFDGGGGWRERVKHIFLTSMVILIYTLLILFYLNKLYCWCCCFCCVCFCCCLTSHSHSFTPPQSTIVFSLSLSFSYIVIVYSINRRLLAQ